MATDLATRLMRICSASTPAGSLWQVDPALRPEGKNGPLVRTLASHRAYYERWAKTWEFQALLKARPIAGDPALGDRRTARPCSRWSGRPSARENFVDDVQAMRRRVEQHIPAAEADRQLKLGPGGLRDVEFSVQLLQLVHGRADESLRTGTTLDGARGPVRRGLRGARRRRDARHGIPAAAHARAPHPAVPAAAHPPDAHRRERPAPAGSRLWDTAPRPPRRSSPQWRAAAARGAPPARAHLLPAAARGGRPAVRLRRAAHPRGGPRAAVGAGLPRPRAARCATSRRSPAASAGGPPSSGTLLPVMLGWFADEADPDAGLLAFRKISDELGSTHWYLRLLRDEGSAARTAGAHAGSQPVRGRPARAGARVRAVPRRLRRA